MLSIRDLVQKALTIGYLTLATEEQLRQLLQTKTYEPDELNAFMKLQQAAMEGDVRQESRELYQLELRSQIL
ncbi:hypothetical protein [Coleofasciculus sp. E1-EBD-02]|jgi:hypothetical protein|uniref:hypothetical protein n=1 Tax=Coleofasciculus sp. E1-EBD-02 TaxID=3068481 RepID=UPI0032F2767D